MSDTALVHVRARLDDEADAQAAIDTAQWALFGAAAGAVFAMALAVAGQGPWPRLLAALLPAVVASAVGWQRARRRWTAAAAAEALEQRHGADNLVVTAEALGRHGAHPWLARVAEAAWLRLASAPPTSRRPAWLRLGMAAGLVAAALAVPTAAVRSVVLGMPAGASAADPAPARITAMAVRVVPPAYLGGAPTDGPAPPSLDVVAGSAVTLRVETAAVAVEVSRDGGEVRIVDVRDGVAEFALPSPPAGTWLVTPAPARAADGGRLLSVRVVADAPPVVRVTAPGRDRRQSRPLSNLAVTIDARDDHALRDVHLRFTTVSGSGEGLTFADRDVPAVIARHGPGAWTATAVLPLASLAVEDGDLVVYRGVAADHRPGAPAIESDAFVVDIGPLREASAAGGGGEDVDPEDRQGISQQMVIVKTERLHAQRATLGAEAALAESQGLAIEQRMVRAEFVFLMGGEVQDEVEEAAHAHDLVEGRLENEGQAALLGATRAMSRAEARLTAGDTAGALVAEREALRLLRQAFDRRRFLLRPVAERARLEPGAPAAGGATSSRTTGPSARVDGAAHRHRATATCGRRAGRGHRRPQARSRDCGRAGRPARSGRRPRGDRGRRAGPGRVAARTCRRAGRGSAPRARRGGAAAAPGATAATWRRCEWPGGRRAAPAEATMNGTLRAFAFVVAIASVLDPALEREAREAIRVGVRVATASPSDEAERLVARLTDVLGEQAVIVREAGAGDTPWCVDVAVCVALGDGAMALAGRPLAPVQAVHVSSSGPLRVVAARVGPGHVAERSEAVVAVAGGREGEAVEVVIDDRGVEVGRVAHRRSGYAVDRDIVVPWWPRGAGARMLGVRIEAPGGDVAPPATTIADTASSPADVLVWEARPSWTGTFIRRALQDDARLAVRAASQVAPGRVVGRGLTGRPDDEALRRAHVVVVTGANALDGAAVATLEQFARGGGVVVVALDEDPVGPVRALLPGVPTGRRRALDPVMVGGVFRAAELVSFAAGAGAIPLARWDDGPDGGGVVMERPTGHGRVVVSGALDAWRWRDQVSGFDRFWQDVVVRSARVAAPPLGVSWRASVGASDVQVVSRDGATAGTWPPLRLHLICAGAVTPLAPIEAAAPGTWTARVPPQAAGCTVEGAVGEASVATAWPGVATVPAAAPAADALERIAAASGGAVVDIDEVESTVVALVAAAPSPLVPEVWHPMRAWWWFVPFTAALAVEWWRRRIGGRA